MLLRALIGFAIISVLPLNKTAAQQESRKDSLINALAHEQNDSLRAKGLLRLAFIQVKEDYNAALSSAAEAIEVYKRIPKIKPIIRLHNLMGDIYYGQARYDRSMESYYRAYQLSDSIGDELLLANSSYNLGWVSALQKGNASEVHLLYNALRIGELKSDEVIVGKVTNALGGFYTNQFMASSEKTLFDSAVKYFNYGIEIARKHKYFKQSGVYFTNMGQLFYHAKDYVTARYYLEKAKELLKKDSNNVVGCIHKLALCDLGEQKTDRAISAFELVNNYCIRHDYKELRIDVLKDLAQAYKLTKNFEKSSACLEEYYTLKSEINEAYVTGSLKNLEAIINYEKSEANVKQLRQSNEIQELKNKRKSFFIYVLIALAFVIIAIAYLLFKQNKLKQVTNLKLQEQNKIITEKKHEIEQSIDYAKGIQTVFLPDLELLQNFLPGFVYYQPKDVVSGDFYWFKQGSSTQELWLACADCTGHGVPGALMSMVGINTLEQLCRDNQSCFPDKILHDLNNAVKDALKQNSDTHKHHDGMDLALVKINKGKNKLFYAGANRPLYLIRKHSVHEFKPDKVAIGGYTPANHSFHSVEIDLEQGDFFVMTTDGFADQFGGTSGKKYMTKNFKNLLLQLNDLPVEQRLTYTEETFQNWKGMYSQVDDVCVIGVVFI